MNIWKDYLKPVVVLVVICVVVSVGLAYTNQVTAPVIERIAEETANAARQALLPNASGFEKVEGEYEGVTDIYKSTDSNEYVITAFAKGYGGDVPVMVAFGEDGKILNVTFMENGETPGLGQKVRDASFGEQFVGMANENFTIGDIDAIGGATISSGASVSAINSAIDAYNAVAGVQVDKGPQTVDEILAAVLPESGATEEATAPAGADAAYTAENGTVMVASASGFYKKPVTAYVGFDADGIITGVYIDATQETQGVGQNVTGLSYGEQYIGCDVQSAEQQVDVVAGATVSSTAAHDAVVAAVTAYETMKEAA